MPRILLVEDDLTLSDGIRLALTDDTLTVQTTRTIAETTALLAKSRFDLLLLDINLPDGSGLSLLSGVKRTTSTPVILLTANDLETDIVTGLESGADDYITKPFSLAILRARVRTQLRKALSGSDVFTEAGFRFDFSRMEFTKDGALLELSKTEQKLLRLLTENVGTTIRREALIDAIWTDSLSYVEENALSVAIKRLREKLGKPQAIQTVYGIGYVWRLP